VPLEGVPPDRRLKARVPLCVDQPGFEAVSKLKVKASGGGAGGGVGGCLGGGGGRRGTPSGKVGGAEGSGGSGEGDGGLIGGDDGGDDGGVGGSEGGEGGDAPRAVPHTTHPDRMTEPSERQCSVCPAAISAFDGPAEPL
jgi:hypothetical protein